MENASKALIIAGAILLSILIIAIGMYIYSSAQAQVNNSITNMSTSEIEGFNSTFTTYEGVQTGSQVKALLQRLIANANTYKDEFAKIPSISYNTEEGKEQGKNHDNAGHVYAVTIEGQTSDYVNYINALSKGLDLKHSYNVVTTSSTQGVIAGITINYSKDDTTENFEPSTATGDDNLHGVEVAKGRNLELHKSPAAQNQGGGN